MFEHLDDPAGFDPDPQLHRAAVARGRRLRLTRRLTAAVGAVTVAALSVGIAGAFYVERRDAAIDRVDVATEPSLDGATNILLVGNDARPGLEGIRPDTIVVLRIEPDGSLRLLSIPRDLIDPRTGQRISAALGSAPDVASGRQALLDAIDGVTGIPIDHYVELDGEGLVDLVDELGGLRLFVDETMVDRRSGLNLLQLGCTTVDGETALALVRARNVEHGAGSPDPWGDLGRMARGQVVITAAVAQLAGLDPGPAELDRLSRILADHAVVDDELGLDQMVELGQAAAGGPGVVASTITPVVANSDGSALLLAPEAPAVFQQFGARPTPPSGDPASGDPAASGTGGQPLPSDDPTDVLTGVPTGDATGIRPC
jgi:LCP family protein required for cell wall assembly